MQIWCSMSCFLYNRECPSPPGIRTEIDGTVSEYELIRCRKIGGTINAVNINTWAILHRL